jgi:hypothetical protein
LRFSEDASSVELWFREERRSLHAL